MKKIAFAIAVLAVSAGGGLADDTSIDATPDELARLQAALREER